MTHRFIGQISNTQNFAVSRVRAISNYKTIIWVGEWMASFSRPR